MTESDQTDEDDESDDDTIIHSPVDLESTSPQECSGRQDPHVSAKGGLEQPEWVGYVSGTDYSQQKIVFQNGTPIFEQTQMYEVDGTESDEEWLKSNVGYNFDECR